jgi:hypothetical protein
MKSDTYLDVFDFGNNSWCDIIADQIEKTGALIDVLMIMKNVNFVWMMKKAKKVIFVSKFEHYGEKQKEIVKEL